jgi:hypothetical protein
VAHSTRGQHPDNLLRATAHLKKHADKRHSEEFNVGAKADLKLQPYVQSSMLSWSNQKLSFKYFGPFRILEQIGSIAYRL